MDPLESSPSAAPVRVAVGLGSNLGDRRGTLDSAVAALASDPALEVLAVSALVENPAVGGPSGQGDYLNGVLVASTVLGPRELLRLLLRVERAHGRDRAREGPGGARTLDLDLLLYGDRVLDEPDLCVPHPRMLERDFVLGPLALVAPGLVHPVTGRSVGDEADRLAQRHLVRPGLTVGPPPTAELEGSAP